MYRKRLNNVQRAFKSSMVLGIVGSKRGLMFAHLIACPMASLTGVGVVYRVFPSSYGAIWTSVPVFSVVVDMQASMVNGGIVVPVAMSLWELTDIPTSSVDGGGGLGLANLLMFMVVLLAGIGVTITAAGETFPEVRNSAGEKFQNIKFRMSLANLRDEEERGLLDSPSRRQVTVKSARKPAEDTVVIVDCTPFCQRFGLLWPECQQIWFVKDICGVICVIFTWGLVFYAQFVVLFVMLIHGPSALYSMINGVIFCFVSFLAVASHVRCMLTDPGAIPRGNATKENIMRLGLKEGQVVFKCPKCVSIKPERAHHCSVCRRCIRKMDHHCPWVNNCIGENNQKYFVLFTMYIFLVSMHALYMSVVHFVSCVGQEWRGCGGYSPPATTVFLIFLIFEGLLFGIFTVIMFGSQIQAICSDETGIESLKKEQATWDKKSNWLSLKSVFGHPFGLHWFSPFATPKLGRLEPYFYTV